MNSFSVVKKSKIREGHVLPDGTITTSAVIAARKWKMAFYEIKNALELLRPIPSLLLQNKPIRNLVEIEAECDSALRLGKINIHNT